MCQPYSGWTNWATWDVNLWLTRQPLGVLERAREMAQRSASALRDWAEDCIFSTIGETGGPADDLLTWAFSKVDWEEVAEALTEGEDEPEGTDVLEGHCLCHDMLFCPNKLEGKV